MKLKKASYFLLFFLFTVISFFMLIPFYKYRSINSGVDLAFHLNRIINLSKTLKHGGLFSYVSTWGLNGIGVPINMVYGCLSIYPFAILFNIFHNKIVAYYTGILLWMFISNVTAFIFGNKYWKNRSKAFLFAIIYTFSNYLFGNFFRIGDIGQAVAWIFMPMLVWGCFSTFIQDDKKCEWYYVPIALSAIIYTHVISTLIAISIVSIFLIISIIKRKHGVIKSVLKQVIFTLGITSFYWINLFLVLKNNINIPPCNTLSGVEVGEFIQQQFTWGGNRLGGIIAILFVIGLFNWKKLNSYARGSAVLALMYSFLMTNISTVILFLLSHTPFKMIQWTGRLMGAVNLFSIIFVVETIEILIKENKFKFPLYLGIIGLFLVDFLGQGLDFIHINNLRIINYKPTISKAMPFENWKINSNNGLKYISNKNYTGVGTCDYWPKESIKSEKSIINNEIFVNGKKDNVLVKKDIDMFTLNTKGISKGSVINTYILYNDNFEVLHNNREIPYKKSNRGTIKFVMNNMYPSIKIRYKVPVISKISIVVSVTMFTILMFLIFRLRYFL